MRRRDFIQFGSFAAIAPTFSFQEEVPLIDQVPPMLDHILLGCNELQRGIDFIEQRTGVRAAIGGVHPGRGTQNALLSLGPSTPAQIGHYLEIIAPDPKQDRIEQDYARAMVEHLKQLASPALVGWAAHPGNIEAFAAKLKSQGIGFGGPYPGSRKRPDGKTLQWKTVSLEDDAHGLLPFFIEWGSGFVLTNPDQKTGNDANHPSTDAPQGCQLLRFELLTPDPAALAALCAKLSLDVPIAKSAAPQLHAVIRGLHSDLSLTS